MASKNTVTLTFAGDSKALSSELDKVGAAAKETEEAFDKLGKGASDGLDKVGTSAQQAGDRFRKSSKDSDEYRSRLDATGESADGLETRFTGLASGIDGVTTLMDDPSPQEFAQGLADISDGVANSFVPAIKRAFEGTKEFLGGLNGLKTVAGVAAAGALAVLTYQLMQSAKAAHDAHFDEVTKELEETGNAAKAAADLLGDKGPDFENMFSKTSSDVGNLTEAMNRLLEAGDFEAANDLIREAGERGDITGDQMQALLNIVDGIASSAEGAAQSQKNLADSIRGVSDAIAAQTDPVMAMIDANNQLRDANQQIAEALGAVNDAVKEHGENSPEAVQALQDLRDAEIDAAGAGLDNEQAIRELTAAAAENPEIVGNVIRHLQSLADQGVISQASVDQVSQALRDVPRRVNSTLTARDRATGIINAVGEHLGTINGQSATVVLNANVIIRKVNDFFGFGAADGGVVPDYLASGGISGPKGTDTMPAWLTPGEMVLNSGQQAQLFAMANGTGGGGGSTVHNHFHIAGSILSERELIRLVGREFQRGGFAGMVR